MTDFSKLRKEELDQAYADYRSSGHVQFEIGLFLIMLFIIGFLVMYFVPYAMFVGFIIMPLPIVGYSLMQSGSDKTEGLFFDHIEFDRKFDEKHGIVRKPYRSDDEYYDDFVEEMEEKYKE